MRGYLTMLTTLKLMPNQIQLLTSIVHNTQFLRAYMGIHMRQEDEAWEKFVFRPSMGHSQEPDRETAPSTGCWCDWEYNTPTQNSCLTQGGFVT